MGGHSADTANNHTHTAINATELEEEVNGGSFLRIAPKVRPVATQKMNGSNNRMLPTGAKVRGGAQGGARAGAISNPAIPSQAISNQAVSATAASAGSPAPSKQLRAPASVALYRNLSTVTNKGSEETILGSATALAGLATGHPSPSTGIPSQPAPGKVWINAQIHSNLNLFANSQTELQSQLRTVTAENGNLKRILGRLGREVQILRLRGAPQTAGMVPTISGTLAQADGTLAQPGGVAAQVGAMPRTVPGTIPRPPVDLTSLPMDLHGSSYSHSLSPGAFPPASLDVPARKPKKGTGRPRGRPRNSKNRKKHRKAASAGYVDTAVDETIGEAIGPSMGGISPVGAMESLDAGGLDYNLGCKRLKTGARAGVRASATRKIGPSGIGSVGLGALGPGVGSLPSGITTGLPGALPGGAFLSPKDVLINPLSLAGETGLASPVTPVEEKPKPKRKTARKAKRGRKKKPKSEEPGKKTRKRGPYKKRAKSFLKRPRGKSPGLYGDFDPFSDSLADPMGGGLDMRREASADPSVLMKGIKKEPGDDDILASPGYEYGFDGDFMM